MLLKTKLAKQLVIEAMRMGISIEVFLKNISVNGVNRGCSGHVVNKNTGSCVYLTTESSCYQPLAGKSMYRLAKDTKDFSSNSLRNGNNRWTENENLASSVIFLLKKEKGEER